MANKGSNRSSRRSIAIAAAASVLVVLPNFLTGALAVDITRELSFGAGGLGLAVGAFRASGALSATYLGAAVDRLGATRSLRLASLLVVASCLGVAMGARSLASLTAWLCLGGAAVSLTQAASNRLILHNAPAQRRGLAFGIKQASVPAGTLFAGLAVALAAPVFGWRAIYIVVAVIAVVVLAAVGRRPASATHQSAERTGYRSLEDRGRILLFGLAFSLAAVPGAVLPAFYVDGAARIGIAPSDAGVTLVAGSVATILVRLLAGTLCDRSALHPVRICASLVATGGLGLLLVATPSHATMPIGLILSMAGAWGFNGVFWYSLMTTFPMAPGLTTGLVAPLGHLGGTLGPIAFGLIASTAGYRAAWLTVAGTTALATMMLLYAAHVSSPRPST